MAETTQNVQPLEMMIAGAAALGNEIFFHIKTLIMILYYSLIAFVPSGILPRKSIRGKIMLITGGGSGIGRLCALEFGKLGATIIIWDINAAGNEETKALLEKAGCKCFTYTIDLTKPDDIYATADRVRAEIGDVDLLMNNAGVVTGKKLFESPDRLIKLTMDVNINALFYTAKAFLPSMLKKDDGHLITVASIAGHHGVAGLVDYCASKHAAVGMNESIRRELVKMESNVKTTCINPYYINTGMFDGISKSNVDFLMPILEPEYVVERIVDAVLTEQPVLFMPRFYYILKACSALLPTQVTDAISVHMGSDDTMNTFVGRPMSPETHAKAA